MSTTGDMWYFSHTFPYKIVVGLSTHWGKFPTFGKQYATTRREHRQYRELENGNLLTIRLCSLCSLCSYVLYTYM